MVEYPYLPTVGRKIAAIVVETAWLSTSAMLMPLERMRVGISSESASHTQTPGVTATSHPLLEEGIGVMSAFSIFSGAVCAVLRSPNGFEKNAFTLFCGTVSLRVISIGLTAASSERTAWLAARKSP